MVGKLDWLLQLWIYTQHDITRWRNSCYLPDICPPHSNSSWHWNCLFTSYVIFFNPPIHLSIPSVRSFVDTSIYLNFSYVKAELMVSLIAWRTFITPATISHTLVRVCTSKEYIFDKYCEGKWCLGKNFNFIFTIQTLSKLQGIQVHLLHLPWHCFGTTLCNRFTTMHLEVYLKSKNI